MKTILFDVWGDWAHFKKFYTTASPLTFHFPPITALKGLIGAIMGFSYEATDNDFYLKQLAGVYLGVQLLRPVKTYRMGSNWIETKNALFLNRIPAEKGRYQTVIEHLKDPAYRIYLTAPQKPDLIDRLQGLLERHQSVYTPFLGISEHLANFCLVDVLESEERQNTNGEFINLETVVSLNDVESESKEILKIEPGKVYQRDRIPVSMNGERVVTRYESVLYEMNGKSILVRVSRYWELNNGLKLHLFV